MHVYCYNYQQVILLRSITEYLLILNDEVGNISIMELNFQFT